MNNEQTRRLKAIQQRKKKREMRRRKIITCVLIIAAILIAVIAVTSLKGCNNTTPNDTVSVELSASPSPVPTMTPTVNSNREIDSEFYASSCFVGNSFVTGMKNYDLVGGADYIGSADLDVSSALTKKSEGGSVYIDELNTNTDYEKIFMMFGEKELAWYDNDTFINEYKKVINKAKKYQPDAEIYLVSVTPVSEAVDGTGENGLTNKNIKAMNGRIEKLAEDTGVIYCDIYNVLVNSDGYLSDDAAEDGVHFEKSGYEKSLVYIQKNYVNKTTDNNDDEEETLSSSSSSSTGTSSSSSTSSTGTSGRTSSTPAPATSGSSSTGTSGSTSSTPAPTTGGSSTGASGSTSSTPAPTPGTSSSTASGSASPTAAPASSSSSGSASTNDGDTTGNSSTTEHSGSSSSGDSGSTSSESSASTGSGSAVSGDLETIGGGAREMDIE